MLASPRLASVLLLCLSLLNSNQEAKAQPPGGYQNNTPTYSVTLLAPVANQGQQTHNFQVSGSWTNIAASVFVDVEMRSFVTGSPVNNREYRSEGTIRLVDKDYPISPLPADHALGIVRNGANGQFLAE